MVEWVQMEQWQNHLAADDHPWKPAALLVESELQQSPACREELAHQFVPT